MKKESKTEEEKIVKLNLGCGYRPINGYINIDCYEDVKPDMVYDLSQFPWPFEDNSVDAIRAFDFLEHIDQSKSVLLIEEIYRILKDDGIFEFLVPSTEGNGAFMDPMHRSYWNRYSWIYFTDREWRDLYGIKTAFKILKLEDRNTIPEMKVIHTYGLFKAIK